MYVGARERLVAYFRRGAIRRSVGGAEIARCASILFAELPGNGPIMRVTCLENGISQIQPRNESGHNRVQKRRDVAYI